MQMRVAILIGSVRSGRQTHKIAYYLERRLREHNVDVDMIDLIYYSLPMMEEDSDSNKVETNEIAQIGKLKKADAIILISPEYHGSFSGVLKNAIDYFWKDFIKKPVGVVTTSTGKMGGINASTQMQHVVLSLGAYPIPQKLLVPWIDHAFDDDFNPLNENLIKATDKFLQEFLWFSTAIMNAKKAVSY
jgi:azobenzene reductase